MIHDSIKNLRKYSGMGLPMEKIAEALEQVEKLQVGKNPLDGEELYANVSDITCLDNPKYEAHRVYADVQYIVSGKEKMMYSAVCGERLTEYDASGDYELFSAADACSTAIVSAGEFAVFFPGEPHAPCNIADADNLAVRKIVFKVKMN